MAGSARARDVALAKSATRKSSGSKRKRRGPIAIEERKRAQVALYFSRIAQGQLQWRVNNVIGARESLAKCLPLAGQEDQRGWEWHYLRGLFHADLFTLHHAHAGSGGDAAFHPDGQHHRLGRRRPSHR